MLHIDRSSLFLLGRELPLYTLLPIFGMMAASVLNAALAAKRGVDPSRLFRLTLVIYFLFLLGQMLHEKLPQGMLLFLQPLGTAAVVIAFGIIGRLQKTDCRTMMDLGAVLVLVYAACVRLGCFFSGCCYGPAWGNGFSVIYGPGTNCPLQGTELFPLQLVSAVILAVILLAAMGKYRKGKHILPEAILSVAVYYLHLWISPATGKDGLCLTLGIAALLAAGCLMIMDYRKGT